MSTPRWRTYANRVHGAGKVNQVLVDYVPSPLTMLATTEAAGVVAVHFAQAVEDLGVLSVAAAATADRQQVFEAAYELARRCRTDTLSVARQSLFELPEGDGDSWQIAEEEVSTYEEGTTHRRPSSTRCCPHGDSESKLDLKASALFGCRAGARGPPSRSLAHSPEGDKTRWPRNPPSPPSRRTGFEAAAASSIRCRT